MLKQGVIAIALVSVSPAVAESYLVHPNAATALARTQQQCAALACDGVLTKYWWAQQTLTDGSVALVIQPSGPFGTTTTVNGQTAGLAAGEIAALQTSTALGTKLPWVISEPSFMARFTPVQISAINASVDAVASAGWTAIKGAATTDLTSAGVVTTVNRIATLGLIPQSQVATVLAPVAVAVVGQ